MTANHHCVSWNIQCQSTGPVFGVKVLSLNYNTKHEVMMTHQSSLFWPDVPVINITTRANELSSPPIAANSSTLPANPKHRQHCHDSCWKQPQLPMPGWSSYTSATENANDANTDSLTLNETTVLL